MEAEIASAIAQFGAAGLIGWMWLMERRSAAERERQVSEAHRRVLEESRQVDVLVGVVEQNTRALAGLERGQAELVRALQRSMGCRLAAGRSAELRGGSGGGAGGVAGDGSGEHRHGAA